MWSQIIPIEVEKCMLCGGYVFNRFAQDAKVDGKDARVCHECMVQLSVGRTVFPIIGFPNEETGIS